jgi:Zn-dependent peptidase ImmA (M78 family)
MNGMIEDETNEFALELLMPTAYLKRAIGDGGIDITNGDVTTLAQNFRVSVQLMAFRLGQLKERKWGVMFHPCREAASKPSTTSVLPQ